MSKVERKQMRGKRISGLLSLLVFVWFGLVSADAQSNNPIGTPKKTRLTVFISDLHLGPGRDDISKEWLKIEDFRWEKEFNQFISFIAKESDNNTDLVIIGDMLELWQSAKMKCDPKCRVLDCEHGNYDLGCSETEVLERARRVIAQHKPLFDSLKRFLDNGTNSIVILPGNHDAALVYPKVAREVLSAITGGPIADTDCKSGQQICVSKKGTWLSVDGLVFADHGHMFDDANSFKKWPVPLASKDGKTYLERPFGEQMVQKFYNTYEAQFPILDNLSKESQGLRYIETEGFSGAINGATDYFRFFLFDLSWKQRIAFLGPADKPQKQPEWDIKEIKKIDVDFLIDSFPHDDRIRALAEENKKDIKIKPEDLGVDEIISLCNYRELRKKDDKKVASCPVEKGSLGWALDKVFDREEINMKNYLLDIYDNKIKTANNEAPSFRIYVYGHTHAAYEKKDKNAVDVKDDGSWKISIFNSGAFQRVATKEQIDKIKEKKKAELGMTLSDADVLTHLRVEDLPACYSYVRLDPYITYPEELWESKPSARLLYWSMNSEGKWKEDTECRLSK